MRRYKRLLFFAVLCSLASGGEKHSLFPHMIASYSTYFETGIEREKNILLAVEKLNGFIMHPGAEFSFNETVTWQIPRDELGFAPAIIEGELFPAAGGGLCQVSSTLYAAAVPAGLTITERKNHSSPVGYISPGLDAAVSTTGNIDLRFRNDEKKPFIIKASAESGTLRISLFSTAPAENEIVVSASLPEKDGRYIYITTRRIFCKNGQATTEILSHDRYYSE